MDGKVCIHKGIHKDNIVMNKKGEFRFMHFSDVEIVDRSSKIDNVPAAEYNKVMIERFVRSISSPKQVGGTVENDLQNSLTQVSHYAEKVVCRKFVPKFVQEYMEACKNDPVKYADFDAL